MNKKRHKPPFLMIPTKAIEDIQLTPSLLMVLGAIIWFHRMKDGKCTASNAYIAEVANCTEGTARNAISKLNLLGYITCFYEKSDKKTRTKILANIPLDSYEVSSDSERVSSDSDTGVISQLHEVSSDSEQNENNINENINENVTTSFNTFWTNYPRKVGKAKCEQWWNKHAPNSELSDKIIDSVEKYKQSSQWKRDNGEYIPHPYTFLNQRRWEDEIQEVQKVEMLYAN